jgi:hypothetical protein
MPRFLLLLSPTQATRGDLSPTAMQRRLVGFADWVAETAAAGVIRTGAPLSPGWVRIERGGGATSVIEADRGDPEALAGYLTIEVEDLAAAVAVAAGCPGADPGTVHVFAIEESCLHGTGRGVDLDVS